jgi:hypothetical protein
MDIQHGHGHAAWTPICSMDMDMQHGHGHTSWTHGHAEWTCSIDMDTQHGQGHGHAAWTWSRSMDLDTKHGLGQRARTCSCIMDLFMQHGLVHAAWTCSCSMDLFMQHGLVHAAGTCSCSMGLDNGLAWMPESRMPMKVQSCIVSFPLVYNCKEGWVGKEQGNLIAVVSFFCIVFQWKQPKVLNRNKPETVLFRVMTKVISAPVSVASKNRVSQETLVQITNLRRWN